MPLMLRYVARSDVGLVREGNEDSGYAGPRLLAVADGMGGHAAGEVASSATIEELVNVESVDTAGDPLEALEDAVTAANARIREMVAQDPARQGMGTTLTALFWNGQALALAHIGDSRAYLLRDGEMSPHHPRPHVRPNPRRRGSHHRRRGQCSPGSVDDLAYAARRCQTRARSRADRGAWR